MRSKFKLKGNIIFAIFMVSFSGSNLASAGKISNEEFLANTTILKAATASTIEVVEYAKKCMEAKVGDDVQGINLGKLQDGNPVIKSFNLRKKNGWYCNMRLGDKAVCERKKDRFEFAYGFEDTDYGTNLSVTLTDKNGGLIPRANLYLSHRNARYEKEGNIFKVSNDNKYSMTISGEHGDIIKSSLPVEMSQLDLINLISSEKFQKKLNLFPQNGNFTIEAQMPYADLSDILKLVIDLGSKVQRK